jgi:hypothetical protein
LIPNKDLFIITSSIKPVIGVFTAEQRFNQTLETLDNVHKMLPEAIIMLVDCSVHPLTDEEKSILGPRCHVFLDLSTEPSVSHFSKSGMKSHAENAMLFTVLMGLKQHPQLAGLLPTVRRIFKLSARSILDKEFDISHYENLFGKFVFKKRISTWMNEPRPGEDNLFITRMFSFCPSLIDTYLTTIQQNMGLLDHLDTEHAHFVNIPQKYLVEFDTIYCSGILAGNGQIEYY